MPRWPLPFLPAKESLMRDAATTNMSGVAVVASATPNTDGSWSTIIASVPWDVDWFDVLVVVGVGANGINSETLMDLAIGPSSSPQSLIDDLQVGWAPNGGGQYRFPLFIPAGAEIIARCRSAIVSASVTIGLDLYGGSRFGQQQTFSKCRTIGASGSNPRGVALTTPGSLNTKSAWTVMEASTAEPIKALIVGPGLNGTTAVSNTSRHLLDIGIGGAGVEQVLIGNVFYSCTASELITGFLPSDRLVPLHTPIPAGERLTVRYARGTAAPTSTDLILYALS